MGWMADEHACYEQELWLAEQWENGHTEGAAEDFGDDDAACDDGEEW